MTKFAFWFFAWDRYESISCAEKDLKRYWKYCTFETLEFPFKHDLQVFAIKFDSSEKVYHNNHIYPLLFWMLLLWTWWPSIHFGAKHLLQWLHSCISMKWYFKYVNFSTHCGNYGNLLLHFLEKKLWKLCFY